MFFYFITLKHHFKRGFAALSNVRFISLKAMKAVFRDIRHMMALLYLLTEAVNRKQRRGKPQNDLDPKETITKRL